MIIGKTPKANDEISPDTPPNTNKAPLLSCSKMSDFTALRSVTL